MTEAVIAKLVMEYGPSIFSWVFVIILWKENKQLTKDVFELSLSGQKLQAALVQHLQSLRRSIGKLK